MMTKAQEYLIEGAKEQLALAEKEIPRLYKEFYEAKKSKQIFPEVYEGMMHTIGYWEGVKSTCNSVIEMVQMTDQEFRNFEMEQEKIRLHNERTKEEILKSLKQIKKEENGKENEKKQH